jgi:hypothetical protein
MHGTWHEIGVNETLDHELVLDVGHATDLGVVGGQVAGEAAQDALGRVHAGGGAATR